MKIPFNSNKCISHIHLVIHMNISHMIHVYDFQPGQNRHIYTSTLWRDTADEESLEDNPLSTEVGRKKSSLSWNWTPNLALDRWSKRCFWLAFSRHSGALVQLVHGRMELDDEADTILHGQAMHLAQRRANPSILSHSNCLNYTPRYRGQQWVKFSIKKEALLRQ